MKVESLGKIGYKYGRRGLQGFLLSMYSELKDLKEKKIVILGCGEDGYIVTNLLRNLGLDIYCYADNSELLQGTMLQGKTIYSPYELFGEDVYFIVAVPAQSIACVRLQFMVHGVKDYSIYFTMNFHDLLEEDSDLQQVILDAINEISFKDKSIEEALPYMAVNVGQDGSRLGQLNYLIPSEEKIYWNFIWTKEFLNNNKNARVLEVGPGFGLMSLVVLKSYFEVNLDWIIFGEPGSEIKKIEGGFDRALLKIAEDYSERVNYEYGYIETNDFVIEKKYDMIILTEVFEHFALNPVNTMKKIKNALKDGGRIVFSTPDHGHVHIWKNWQEMPSSDDVTLEEYFALTRCGHAYQYTKDELLDIFARVGLKVEKYARTETGHHNFLLS